MAVTYTKDRQWYKRFKRDEFKGTHNNSMFKGVPFIIDGDDLTTGRRTVEHQFPQRDTPYSEDLGRNIRTFNVSGMLLGDDYLEQRDNLITVCEEEGQGEFVHPYYGILSVICKSINISNQRTETRVCRFDAIFVETGELTFPIVSSDTTEAARIAVEESLEQTKSSFIDVYDTVKKKVVFVTGKTEVLTEALDKIYDAKSVSNMPSEFYRKYTETVAQIDSLVLNGEDMADDLIELISYGFLDTSDDDVNLENSFEELKTLMDFSTTSIRTSDDTDAMEQLIQLAAVITMGLITTLIDYVSTNDSVYYRTTTLDKIDSLMEEDLDDNLMQSLRDLRATIADDIDSRSLDLPEITTYKMNSSFPVLVISNMLYGSVEQEQDIIDRNNIVHPAWAPGNVDLEVLLNV